MSKNRLSPKNSLLLRQSKNFNPVSAVAVILLIIVAGYFILTTRASGTFVASEAEQATLTGNVTLVNDTNASGGQAIKFGVSSGTVYTTPTSITSDCSVDVAPALNTWIASVPDGTASNHSIVSFPASACYRVEEVLDVWGRSHMDFEGNGAQFKAITNGTCDPYQGTYCSNTNSANNRGFYFIGAVTDLKFNNFKFLGAQNCAQTTVAAYLNCYNASLEGQAGFVVWGANGLTISNNTISHVWGDCLQVNGNLTDFSFAYNVTFTSNSCDHLGRHGWSSGAAQSVTLSNNTYDWVAYSAIDMENDGNYPTTDPTASGIHHGAGWKDINESYETFKNVSLNGIAIQGGANSLAANINFDHLTFINSAVGLTLDAWTSHPNPYFGPINLTNSTSDTPFSSAYRDPIEFLDVVNGSSLISGNTIPALSYGTCPGNQYACYRQPYGIGVWSSNNVSIKNNNLKQAAQAMELDNGNGAAKSPYPATGTPSQNVTICGSTYGFNFSPIIEPGC